MMGIKAVFPTRPGDGSPIATACKAECPLIEIENQVDLMNENEKLERAIAALEAQRAILGEGVVDAALVPLREKLASLQAQHTGQQRKQVTVLFADISGFTALAEMMDAEEVGDMLNELWQPIDAAIVECGGMIDKHIGDAVMALWGVDHSREDDPENAIRAALAMQTAMAVFRDEHTVQLAMRIGINTGPVLLGNVGTTGEFSALGDTVNIAKRLERIAPIGRILISHETQRHVRGIFNMQSQAPAHIKGKSEPVQTYIIKSLKPRAFRMNRRGLAGIETRMVGRDAEMLTLQNQFQAAILEGDSPLKPPNTETRLVTVVGEAGVGKSRLLYEFERWIESSPVNVRHLKGRATPAMLHIPYGIIRDMFASHFAILETDRVTTVREKFHAGMAGILEAGQADLVGHLIGFDFSGSQAVRNLLGSASFKELATAYLINYLRVMAHEPTVIFLEDTHWADDISLDFVEYLATKIPTARLLIVCLARPALFERHRHWGQGHKSHVRLNLNPLPRQASLMLVGEILQKAEVVPQELRDLIVNEAEGNPFYVEELIKMLIEDGVIVRGEDKWRIALNRLADTRVPPTLTNILQARLDSLPREEKLVLQRAAVVGRLFWDMAVAELATESGVSAAVTPLLDAIQKRELIFRRRRSAFEGTREYIFKHAILRDVTYETVLLKLRRRYHAQVAKWLESNAGERLGEYLSLIAQHYELAGERAKAADYLQRSGKELFDISAYRAAIGAFERVLELLPENDVTSRAAILVRLGYAYRQLGDYPLATQHLQKSLALVSNLSGNSLPVKVAALNGLGWSLMGQGAYVEAEHYLKQSLSLAREIDDQEGLATTLCNLGDVAYRQGKSETAQRYAQESLTICKELGNRQGMAFALRVLGFAAHLREDHQETARYHRESQVIYREIGDRWGVATCFINLGEVARKQARYEEAAQYYEESLPIFNEIDNRMGNAIATLNLGHVYTGMSQDDTAWKYLCEALRAAIALGAFAILLEGMVGVALLCTRDKRYKRAAELWGLVLAHPALNQEIVQCADPFLAKLREALPATQFEAALERGQALDVEQVVAEILAENSQ